MYIVQVASECAPVIKAGGLGDVVYGLSRELEMQGALRRANFAEVRLHALRPHLGAAPRLPGFKSALVWR